MTETTAKRKPKEPTVTDATETCGSLADSQAKDQGIAGRQFSFKLDGVVARREAPSSLLEGATVVELVEVTDYAYPEAD